MFAEPSERHTVLSGGKVSLPCDIISPMIGDEVYLVLWYKGEIATPIYSFDARRGHVGQARHSSSDLLSRRAYFSTTPRPAVLEIFPVGPEDEGEYRCRVDFRKAQTRNYQIAVKVLGTLDARVFWFLHAFGISFYAFGQETK
ncbi:UNVERIFIED_CONTAM: hypothetical protein NCL1_34101 [Trichonephila clavipes]